MTEVSFEVSSAELELIDQIKERAIAAGLCDTWYTPQTCLMDLCACQANGNPLRLEELLQVDDFNFIHDISGIARHMDRETGQIGGMFSPRFSRRD